MRKLFVFALLMLVTSFAGAQLYLNGNVTPTLQYILDSAGQPTALQISTTAISPVGISGSNSDELTVGITDNTALLDVNGTNTGVFMCVDDAGAANCTFDTTGAGIVTIGSADVTAVSCVADGGTLSVGATASELLWTALTTGPAVIKGADAAGNADTTFDTTGAGAIDVGSADVTDVQLVTDGGSFDMGTTANAASVIAAAGQTATLILADDAGAANGAIDVAGAGALTLGSADVTSITLTTDGSGTAEVVLPLQSVAGAEILNDTVDGAQLADTVTLDATLALSGQLVTMDTGVTVSGGDVTLSVPTSNGNAGVVNQFIGIPRIKNVGIGTMVNGTTQTVTVDIGDSETPSVDWTAVDADVTVSDDGTYYRQGTASLKLVVATTADDGDGVTNALATGNQDYTDDEAVGFWLYATTTLAAGDLVFSITDSVAGETRTDVPVYATANTWQWTEVDISGVANASKDVITDVGIELSAAGAAVAAGATFDVYVDQVIKWDVADEDSLGTAILADGALSITVIDATDGGATSVNLVEYTDYVVHYQSGNDAIVMITDQSGADRVGVVLVAY